LSSDKKLEKIVNKINNTSVPEWNDLTWKIKFVLENKENTDLYKDII
jgi:vacuolar-type H+-ATPase subunit D/Vma8